MRPIRLTMQAFGPFAGREVVDFRDAMESGLFGIYGPTGAGKSTIFSAVTFALFGEATRADQDTDSLRSDHADPGTVTEVEFVFEVGEQRFVVRRRPDQKRPKLRGAGETEMAHEAFLFDATGLSVEDIGGGNSGKVIAERKTGAVRAAVEQILGYGAAQFRQIVLLPQGKFEMFLAAKTDARLVILRELFDVSLYRRLAASFKERGAAAEREVIQEREVCARRLAAEGFESSDALLEGIGFAEGEQERALEAEKQAHDAVGAARGKLEAAGKIDGLFEAAEGAASTLAGLLGREGEVRELEERVENARRALALTDVERFASEARGSATEFEEKLSDALRLSAGASEAARLARLALDGEKARAHELDELRRRGESFVRYQVALADAAGLEEALREKVDSLSTAKTAFETADQRRVDLVAEKLARDEEAKRAREKAVSRAAWNLELAKLGSALKEADGFEKAQKNLERLRAATARMEGALKTKTGVADEAKIRFDRAEADLAAAQALHLAAKLAPGESCPVCGSLEHPAPATGKIENQGRDPAFREARRALEDACGERDKAAGELSAARDAIEETEKDFSDLARPGRSAALLREEVATVRARIAELGPEVDVAAADRLVEETGKSVVAAEGVKDRAREELVRVGQEEALARDRYEKALTTIPEGYRDARMLETASTKVKADIAARQAALKAAEEGERRARENEIGARKDAEAAQTAYREAINRRETAQAQFALRLEEGGMTEELYRWFRAWAPTIDADVKEVDEYKTAIQVARKGETDAQSAIAGLERPDLVPLGETLNVSEGSAKAATDQRALVDARLGHLRGVRDGIAETLRKVDELVSRTAPLRELARLFNAENAMKLNLETYAIGAMFDYVLAAANLRLEPMTNGRYTLEREIEAGDGRARRGLGIRVFDVYTGKARTPSTLSGGETFIAALALALGLSDVVESVNGKIHLDTIFIDEGFGSLDTENESGTLDQVLQVLTKLVSQRRAVGLISHVRLVQEAIPNGLYVRKELNGSRIEVRPVAA